MTRWGDSMDLRDQQTARATALVLPEPWQSADVVIVLPTYQESANLPVVLAQLFDLPLNGLRVLVVDDNSPDGTGQIAEQLTNHYGRYRLSVIHRCGKEGLGRAYIDGMSRAMAAGAELVVQMDADLSHPPEYLPQMVGTLLSSDADVVIGSRYVVGASLGEAWPRHRKALSSFANSYVRVLLKLGVRDATAGFKVWRSSALEAIGLPSVRSNGYSFQVEMNYRALLRGLKIVELPIHFADRLAGESKMSLKVQLESALMPFRLRRAVASHPRSGYFPELGNHG
jgi:dolichol-phosphate mannosyltransferase